MPAHTRTRLADQLGVPCRPGTAVPLMLEITNRVLDIHVAGQHHEDLSPHNIWFTSSGAVEIESCAATPVRGASDPKVCIAGDIHILGVVFYEMVVGRHVFEQHLVRCGAAENLPSLSDLSPGCPRPLSDLLRRMLAKAVPDRVQSLDEVVQALRDIWLRLEDTHNDERGAEEGGRPPRSRKWVYGTLAAAVIVASFAAVVSTIAPAPRPRLPAVQQHPSTPVPAPAPLLAISPAVEEFAKTIATPTGAMTLIPGETPFYIDTYEVTNRLYGAFVASTIRHFPRQPPWDRRYFRKPDYPVVNVAWEDAVQFCGWAGKRLPAPAEWEKAALGADGRKYPWGNFTAPNVANWKTPGDGHPYTAPVGSFPFDFSPYGVLDMAGNVPEWVADRTLRGGWFGMAPEVFTLSPPAPAPGVFSPAGFRCTAGAAEAVKLIPHD